jgi:hypothetical protein
MPPYRELRLTAGRGPLSDEISSTATDPGLP